MARKQRISYPGMHHIINRGVGKRNVFLADEEIGVGDNNK